MATGCVQGCQTPRALPQDQCVCSVRPSARQDSAASPGRLRESGAGCPGDGQKVNKPWDIKAHVSASFAPRLHSNASLFTGGKQWMGVSSTPWSRQWLSGAIRSAPSWRKTPLRLCWKAKAPHHTQSCSSGTTGPVLCYYRRCMSTDGLWVALVQCRDCMKIKTRPQRTSKVELLFSKFLLWLIILVSEGTPVLSSEKCDLEPTASFLFFVFFAGYSRITPAEASIHYFYHLFLLLTCDKGLSVFHLFCSLDTCRFEMYPLLLPLISLTLAWRQYILIMY